MTDPREMPEPPKQVADAPKGNWVDRFAPAWSVPYLRLSRADRPIGTWLLYIPCLWGVALAATGDGFRLWDLWIVVSCGVGAFLMRGRAAHGMTSPIAISMGRWRGPGHDRFRRVR